MPTSDAAANATLDREVSAGGSWWVGLALNAGVDVLDAALTVPVIESALPRVELPRDGAATWEAASSRMVRPLAAVSFGAAPADETPTYWVLWSAETGGTPQHAGQIPDSSYTAGTGAVLPAESLVLTHP